MTNAEADALIASLPQPGNLRLYRDGDRIVMDGGKWGPHLISVGVSGADRLLTHWKGYVETQGLSLGPDYSSPLPLGASQERDYQPGDRIEFIAADYAAAGGWRPGTVVRATPKRVLVEFVYKYEREAAKKAQRDPRASQRWKNRDEVRRR